MTNPTPTVYAFVYPETREITGRMWAKQPHWLYSEPWTQKQDEWGDKFLDAWVRWTDGYVLSPLFDAYRYVTSGSSEAIRESISMMTPGTTLHVFEGEYEGYESYADAHNIKVKKHHRSTFFADNPGEHFYQGDAFYVSNPSAINGNLWSGFDSFLKYMGQFPWVTVCVDLTYVGAITPMEYRIDCTYNNVDRIFFSLSKPFGLFYHRIGGVFSREPMPGLYGNKWFYNPFSAQLGMELMRTFPTPVALPRRYKSIQEQAVERVDQYVYPSDVVMLACKVDVGGTDAPERFRRNRHWARWCLTPLMDEIVCGT